MNPTIESVLRLVNLTASGLLAGSLGFGDAVLVPGAEGERPHYERSDAASRAEKYFNSIGPIALATSMAVAVGSRDRSATGRVLDAASALGLAGVVGTTMLVTVPLNRRLQDAPPVDYYDESSHHLGKNWTRAHTVRTALGIGAFVCAAAANALRIHRRA